MEVQTLAAGTFKATCLKLMDEVAETGRSVVITKRGKPVARVVPIEKKKDHVAGLFGCLAYCTRIRGDIVAPLPYGFDTVMKFKRIEAEALAWRAARRRRRSAARKAR